MSRIIKHGFCYIITALIFISCSKSDPIIDDIRQQGKLVVLTLNMPTTYYLGVDNTPTGFEHDLSKALADSLNVEVEYKLFDNIEGLLTAINHHEGHLIAAGLTQTPEREASYLFGPHYMTVQQQVICHRNAHLPKTVEDLLTRSLLIVAGSSYQETLLKQQKKYPTLQWEKTDELSSEQVLEKLEKKQVDCTILDSNIFSLNRRYYPNLVATFSFSGAQNLAWILPNTAQYFKQYVTHWFVQIKNNSLLNIIDERYYGYADMFDFYNNHIFLKRIKARLPKYISAFKHTATHDQIPWTLLAAQAYQESGWNPNARSHTGVRGLMMLTQTTAQAMGIETRTDPLQSIRGGGKYLSKMLKKVPEDVATEDRIWFALAAYNVGFAHLLDARKLARKLGKSPSNWHDMRQILPLLSQKKYYKDLKHGYARGSEPVKYIDRIRYYQDVLIKTLKNAQALTP